MARKLFIVSILSVLSSGLCIYRYFFAFWPTYYQEKLYKEPRPLLREALGFLSTRKEHEKKALDLGAGSGNETAYLLKNGWKVWSVDNQEESIRVVGSRADIAPYLYDAKLITKSFAHIAWHELPQFDFIFAGYSLSFLCETEFCSVLNNIQQALKQGGVFAGHFFIPNNRILHWRARGAMTSYMPEEIIEFFKEHQIKLCGEFHRKNSKGVWFNVIVYKP